MPKGIGARIGPAAAPREARPRRAFDAARKRPLPAFVRHIALVTSPTGAAIHDFLQVLGRRWRGADVLVVPVRVQGEGRPPKSPRPFAPSTGWRQKVSGTVCAKHPKGRRGKRS